MTDHRIDTSPQYYARVIAVLMLISLVAGGFGEFYAPSHILVSGDATTTANNIRASGLLFGMGFAGYLVEACCDIALALYLYLLLRPVRKDLALVTVGFRLVSTATFAIAELFYFAASFILGGGDYLKTFSADQLNSLAFLSLKFYGYGSSLFIVFYGIAFVLYGYLIFQSGYLPKVLGVLLAFGGLGFMTKSFALVLAPAHASDNLLLPMVIAALALTIWLIVKGVNVAKWNDKVSASPGVAA